MGCIYTIEYYSAFRKEHHSVCDNMDETWGHHAKLSKAVTEGHILLGSTSMSYLK